MSKSYVSEFLRKQIKERAEGLCEYCLLPSLWAGVIFPIEHIIPESKGGKTTLENLAYACPNCNTFKHVKTEGIDQLTKNVAPIFHPRIHDWKSNFTFNKGKSIIIGISPIGRVTVSALKMNEVEMKNLRKALFAFGVYPPNGF